MHETDKDYVINCGEKPMEELDKILYVVLNPENLETSEREN